MQNLVELVNVAVHMVLGMCKGNGLLGQPTLGL